MIIFTFHHISGETAFLKQLRSYMIDADYFSAKEADIDFFRVKETAELIVEQRNADTIEGSDGLDGVRHNLPDNRLIICSMEGERSYPDIDRLLTEEEFRDMIGKVVSPRSPAISQDVPPLPRWCIDIRRTYTHNIVHPNLVILSG